jgi:hypothetical protein
MTWFLVRKPEGKRPRCRLVDNINMDLVEIGWNDMNWIDLAQDRYRCRALVIEVMTFQIPKNYAEVWSGQLVVSRVVHRPSQLDG